MRTDGLQNLALANRKTLKLEKNMSHMIAFDEDWGVYDEDWGIY